MNRIATTLDVYLDVADVLGVSKLECIKQYQDLREYYERYHPDVSCRHLEYVIEIYMNEWLAGKQRMCLRDKRK